MSIRSRWLFVLVGGNNTGKTTIQRRLVQLLGGRLFKRLTSNNAYDLTHLYLMRKFRRFFVAGRSYQELVGREYTDVASYFAKLDAAGPDIDLVFMATHLSRKDAGQMIRQAHRRFYNVCGIFLSNSIAGDPKANAGISRLPWDERWLGENPPIREEPAQTQQLESIADMMVQMLIERTRGW